MQIVIDGILTNYISLGKEKSKTFVILHGWGQSSDNWIEFANLLIDKYRVILLDLPGFGGTSVPEKAFDTYDYAKFVEKFLREIEVEKYILMGHSFGGKISTVVGSRNKSVHKLILVSPSGVFVIQSLMTKARILFARSLKPIWKLLPKFMKGFLAKITRSEDYNKAGELKEIFKKVVREGILKGASKIKIPVLIIWGQNDSEVPMRQAKLLQKHIDKSKVRIVWKAGHNVQLDKRDSLYEIITDFISN